MLVLGWTLMGRRCSSYDYTMGFGVSARVAQKSTRLSVIPPYLLCKINKLISNSEVLATFVRTKVAQKALGCSPSGQTTQRHRAAAYLQATYAPDKSRIKQIFASHLAVCLLRLSRNPKPDESLNCYSSSEIRGLQISYNKTSKMPNSDAKSVFGHDSRCAERRGLWLLT